MSILSIHNFTYQDGDNLGGYYEIISHHRGHPATYRGPTLREAIKEWRKYRYVPDIKYAVAGICDQTHWYLSSLDWPYEWALTGERPCGTITHSRALLFDTLEEAQKALLIFDPDGWIEIVSNVEEFRSREDTW